MGMAIDVPAVPTVPVPAFNPDRAPRKKMIAANWKMHCTTAEASALVRDVLAGLGSWDQSDVVLCPPFTALAAAAEALGQATYIRLGGQNLHPGSQGAFTGEISARMLKDLYCQYVILGHSERRQLFGETNAFIAKKVAAALEANLKPILCIGETFAQREANAWKKVLEEQLTECLAPVTPETVGQMILAYEPVWAIGTGKNATPEQAQQTHTWIRAWLSQKFGPDAASRLRILYGGSAKPDNAMTLISQPDVDGFLVGGASLEARAFCAIVKSADFSSLSV